MKQGILSQTLILHLICLQMYSALDNGLALKPPMGWISSRNANESEIKTTIDVMSTQGYKDLGYEYIIINSGWQDGREQADDKLRPKSKLFPEGMKKLSDYVHSKGFKFGLHFDIAEQYKQDEKYPRDHKQKDAQSFAEWGVDYLQFDDWRIFLVENKSLFQNSNYWDFGEFLNQTGRPMVYYCRWLRNFDNNAKLIDYATITSRCNIWENSWQLPDPASKSPADIEKFASFQNDLQPYTGPGHWNTQFYLLLGQLWYNKEISQMAMALWAILGSPLIIFDELERVKPQFKSILLNKDIVEVNQDALGIAGRRLLKDNYIEIWTRPITPVVNGHRSYAIAVINRDSISIPHSFSISLNKLGFNSTNGYTFRDLYSSSADNATTFVLRPDQQLNVTDLPQGVKFFKATVLP